MKIGIIGCSGRMGRALIEEIHNHEKTALAGGVVKHDSEFLGIDLGALARMENIGINASADIKSLCEISDALIDFTNPTTSLECAKHASELKKIYVCGTTGFNAEQQKTLENLAKKSPFIWSSNMSLGVNILQALTEQVSSLLGIEYDIEILEMHHYQKIDAPSGTALSLGEAAARGRNVNLAEAARKSRDGIIGKRIPGEIGFATLRGGDVIGEHTVIFAGDGERLELTHKASSRKIFAKGAIYAALWAKNKKPGFYTMKNVLSSAKEI